MAKKQLQETFPKISMDREKIFTIVEMKKNNFQIALGNEIVEKQVFKTKQAAQEHIDQKNWEMTMNVLCVLARKVYEYQKHKENDETK